MIIRFLSVLLIVKCKYYLSPPNMYNINEEFTSINGSYIEKNITKSFTFKSNNYRFFK